MIQVLQNKLQVPGKGYGGGGGKTLHIKRDLGMYQHIQCTETSLDTELNKSTANTDTIRETQMPYGFLTTLRYFC